MEWHRGLDGRCAVARLPFGASIHRDRDIWQHISSTTTTAKMSTTEQTYIMIKSVCPCLIIIIKINQKSIPLTS